jgi:hypothetical protein
MSVVKAYKCNLCGVKIDNDAKPRDERQGNAIQFIGEKAYIRPLPDADIHLCHECMMALKAVLPAWAPN